MSSLDKNQAAYLDVEISSTCRVEVLEGDLLVKHSTLAVAVKDENISEGDLDVISKDLNLALKAFNSNPPAMNIPLIKGLVNSNTTIFYNEHFIEVVTEL